VFVVTLLATPVAEFLITTWAFATAAPDGSVIVPESVPPATCARDGSEFTRQSPKIHTKRTNFIAFGFIRAHPPFYFRKKQDR
jgi:hypothetical protein